MKETLIMLTLRETQHGKLQMVTLLKQMEEYPSHQLQIKHNKENQKFVPLNGVNVHVLVPYFMELTKEMEN